MPSPFPGMNPFLEQNDTWQDFHSNFLVRAQEWLSPRVGPNYLVKIEVRLLLHELSSEERRFMGVADVGLISHGASAAENSVATLDAPVSLRLPRVEVERHSSLEVRDRRNRRVVTVIELLSPSNKVPGEDRDDYLAKRRQTLAGMTHFVEIDLRRGGQRPSPPDLPPSDYYCLVSRYRDRPNVGVWPFGLRDPLPVLPIPLDDPDPPARLDLKAVLDQTYDASEYAKYIYQETPDPPLAPEDDAWARQLLASRPLQGSP